MSDSRDQYSSEGEREDLAHSMDSNRNVPHEDPLAEFDEFEDNSGPDSVKHGGLAPRPTHQNGAHVPPIPPAAVNRPVRSGSAPIETAPVRQPSSIPKPNRPEAPAEQRLSVDEHAIYREMEVLPPELGWQGFLYRTIKVRVGPSKKDVQLRQHRAKVISKDRSAWKRINRAQERTNGYCGFISVVSEKGGVGKTTVSVLLSYVLAEIRKDPVGVADLNPDRGSLPRRFGVQPKSNIRDLIQAYGDIPHRRHVHEFLSKVPGINVSVLAGDTNPHRRDKTSDGDVKVVAELFKPYFSIGVLDNGTGISHSALEGSLSVSHAIALVIDNTEDAYDFVEGTLTYLQDNGYEDLRKRVVLVVIDKVPSPPIRANARAISSKSTEMSKHTDVTAISIQKHFREMVRSTVIIPFDPALSKAGPIPFDLLREPTVRAVRELAASLMDDLVK